MPLPDKNEINFEVEFCTIDLCKEADGSFRHSITIKVRKISNNTDQDFWVFPEKDHKFKYLETSAYEVVESNGGYTEINGPLTVTPKDATTNPELKKHIVKFGKTIDLGKPFLFQFKYKCPLNIQRYDSGFLYEKSGILFSYSLANSCKHLKLKFDFGDSKEVVSSYLLEHFKPDGENIFVAENLRQYKTCVVNGVVSKGILSPKAEKFLMLNAGAIPTGLVVYIFNENIKSFLQFIGLIP